MHACAVLHRPHTRRVCHAMAGLEQAHDCSDKWVTEVAVLGKLQAVAILMGVEPLHGVDVDGSVVLRDGASPRCWRAFFDAGAVFAGALKSLFNGAMLF